MIGRVLSAVIAICAAAVEPLLAPSLAALAGIVTVTCPSALGVTVMLYWAPLPVSADAVPFAIWKSASATPVTGSVNVAVIVKGPEWGLLAEVVSVTPGAVLSEVNLRTLDAKLGAIVLSTATPAAMDTVTGPSAAGAMLPVQPFLLQLKTRADTLVVTIESGENPFKGRENWMATGNDPLITSGEVVEMIMLD